MNHHAAFRVYIFFTLSASCATQVHAEDWPTRLYDIRRGGITREQLTLPLVEEWNHKPVPPSPAWAESPAFDGQTQADLKPRQNFDVCFDVAIVGDRVYYGSSSTGAVTCLDIKTGKIIWTFITDGPIRCAPHVARGNVYIGSDDGNAYCLNASDGSLRWKNRAGPEDRMLWGNGRLISPWPVRSAVIVDGDSAFWSAGLFPREGMYICKRNALDGTPIWTKQARRPPQGYLVASSSELYVPCGKGYPAVYDRKTGAARGDFKASGRDGGTWALLSPEEDRFWSGPAEKNAAYQFDTKTKTYIAMVGNANFLIVDATNAYYVTDRSVAKINRADRSVIWSRDYTYPYALIKAGNTLFVGGESEVAAINDQGNCVWTAPVDGAAYGLAAANGHLFASTDTGAIHCFGNGKPMVAATRKPPRNPFEVDVRAIEYKGQVQDILARAGVNKGTCLIFGCGDGHLAYEITKQTDDLNILCVDPDNVQVDVARKNLSAAGIYDKSVRVAEGTFTSLADTTPSADLVLITRATRLSAQTDTQRRENWQKLRQASAEDRDKIIQQMRTEYRRLFQAATAEAYRVLKPSGGVLFVEIAEQRRSSTANAQDLRNWLRQGPFNPDKDHIESTASWLKLTRGNEGAADE
jgi:outer membrane protein assembly factor BamB